MAVCGSQKQTAFVDKNDIDINKNSSWSNRYEPRLRASTKTAWPRGLSYLKSCRSLADRSWKSGIRLLATWSKNKTQLLKLLSSSPTKFVGSKPRPLLSWTSRCIVSSCWWSRVHPQLDERCPVPQKNSPAKVCSWGSPAFLIRFTVPIGHDLRRHPTSCKWLAFTQFSWLNFSAWKNPTLWKCMRHTFIWTILYYRISMNLVWI